MSKVAFVLAVSVLAVACESVLDPSGPRPEGLGLTKNGQGPRVVWDVEHSPLPEIPLPNDQATRLDPSSPTGRRVNVGQRAQTRYEERTRKLFNALDGFGAYGPITVRFDAPLDLPDLRKRHVGNDDFRDDAVLLLNVDRRCQRFGEEVALDFGRGRFPITLMSRSRREPDPMAPDGYRVLEDDNKMFPLDPVGESLNVLFPDWNEDTNENGKIDPGEDVNDDGVLQEANFEDPHACDEVSPSTPAHDRCVADNLVSWYERATDTLILRPVWPLEERCTYAVVLTNRLRDTKGNPVRSPFSAVQPADQVEALKPVAELLSRYALTRDDVAFAWSFTVGTMTKDLELVRKGLYGHGPLARFAEEFPTSSLHVWTRNQWRALGDDPKLESGGGALLMAGGCAAAGFATVAGTGDGDKQICGGYADFAAVGGVFGGDFESPNLLVDKNGQATEAYPADEDEAWDLEAEAGRATYGRTKTTFFCALPREDARPKAVRCQPGNPKGVAWCKPYPVVFYAHGYGGFKGEVMLHAGRHAQLGFAACGLDSYGHGRSVVLDAKCKGASDFKLGKLALTPYDVPELATMVYHGRDRDLNNDGCSDSGADQWTANLFHTRDVVRQSVLEEMQFVRILHAIDGRARDAAGNVLGDVDLDGKPDFGGRRAITAAWGISLGGQLTAVLAGAEPTLDATVPNAVGAGLTDIAVRLGEGGLAEAVMLPVQGPVVVGCLPTDEHQNPLSRGQNDRACLPAVAEQQPAVAGPQKAGELLLAWYGHDNAKFAVRAFARVPGVAAGDLVRVENLDKGLSTTVTIGARGFARAHIAADALWPVDRRALLGLKDGDQKAVRARDVTALGDRMRISVLSAKTERAKHVIDTWHWDVTFQGTIYPAKQPLVAMQEGMGYARNTPDFRRFYGISAHAVAPADPAVWSRRYFEEPVEAEYDPAYWRERSHVMVMPTVGDSQVPTATGVALGRSSGLLGSWDRDPERYDAKYGWRALSTPDPRYGKSVDHWLIDNHVVEGDHRLQRWADHGQNPDVLFDPDDVSDGAAAFSCLHSYDWSAKFGEFYCPPAIDDTDTVFSVPHPPEGKALRIDRKRDDGSYDAFRIPLLRPGGQHGIYNPQPFRAFDADAYMVNFVARYMASRATNVQHEPGCDCAYAARPNYEFNGQVIWPGIEDGACDDGDPAYGKVCSESCAKAWGFQVLPINVCEP